MDAGQTTQAFDAFTQWLQEYPASPLKLDAWFRQGVCAYQLARWTTARDIFQQLAAQQSSASSTPATLQAGIAFYLAELDYRDGRYPTAIAQYQAIIASPQSSSYKSLAQLGLGWAYYQQGRCEESFAALEPLRHEDAPSVLQGASLVVVGDCARRLGRNDDAIAAFRQLLTQDPANAWADEAALRLGELLVAGGHDAEARALFEQQLRDHPTSAQAPALHVQAGHLALKANTLAAARAHFHAVVTRSESSPLFVAALVGLGDTAFEQGEFEEAARHYARVVLAAPHGPYAAYAFFQRAQALLNLGQWAAARNLYQQLVAEFPVSRFIDEAMFRLGQAWAAEGLSANAIESWAQLVARAPRSPWAQHAELAWADALAQAGQWQAAATHYTQLLQQNPAPDIAGTATIHQATALAAQGQRPAAVAMLRALLRQSSPASARAEAHLVLARWAAEDRIWDRANDEVTQALPLAAGTAIEADVLFFAGWLACQRHEWTAAVARFDHWLDRYPHDPQQLEGRAWRLLATARGVGVPAALETLTGWLPALSPAALEQIGRRVTGGLREEGLAAEAIQVYTFLIARVPEDRRPEWWYVLGETYEETHALGGALAMYRRAAEAHPAQPWAARGALAAARLLEADRQWDAATQLYRRVSATSGPEAAVALERLQALEARQ